MTAVSSEHPSARTHGLCVARFLRRRASETFSAIFRVMWQDIAHSLQAKLADIGNTLSFAPAWAVTFVILIVAFVVAWLVHAAILVTLRRLLRNRRPFLRTILEATKGPTRLALLIAATAIALPTAPVASGTESIFAKILTLATICLTG